MLAGASHRREPDPAVGHRRALAVRPSTPPSTPLPWPEVAEGPAPAAEPRGDSAPQAHPGSAGAARLLVGGVGYRNLRDYSLGPALVERLQAVGSPPRVVIEDLSVGPIDVLFRLQAEPVPFAAGLFVGAMERGRPPGTVELRRWSPTTPSLEELQARVAEAVTGVISLENLLLILQHFGALPAETLVLEIEPSDAGWGQGFSSTGQAAFAEAEAIARDAIAAFLERQR